MREEWKAVNSLDKGVKESSMDENEDFDFSVKSSIVLTIGEDIYDLTVDEAQELVDQLLVALGDFCDRADF